MSEQVETLRTAAELLAEATRYVNFRPDQKHPEQARYDALQSLTNVYAYCTVVALETLRRIDPEAAERVAEHCGLDDWQAVHGLPVRRVRRRYRRHDAGRTGRRLRSAHRRE